MNRVTNLLQRLLRGKPRTEPAARAYDLLAAEYDRSGSNLMIALDERIVPELLQAVPVGGKAVLDFGCGTGRWWPYLLSLSPALLTGYDASEGMLALLRQKYPQAAAFLTDDGRLQKTAAASIDVIVSTLTIHYLQELEPVFGEWNRVLKPGGQVVITGYHPESLQNGGFIRFSHGSRTIAIAHNDYPLDAIRDLGRLQGWTVVQFVECGVDDSVKHFYERADALAAYEEARKKPIIYGMVFRKGTCPRCQAARTRPK